MSGIIFPHLGAIFPTLILERFLIICLSFKRVDDGSLGGRRLRRYVLEKDGPLWRETEDRNDGVPGSAATSPKSPPPKFEAKVLA